jgi:hypothetical protein
MKTEKRKVRTVPDFPLKSLLPVQRSACGAPYFAAVALRIFLIRLRTVSLGCAPWPIQ